MELEYRENADGVRPTWGYTSLSAATGKSNPNVQFSLLVVAATIHSPLAAMGYGAEGLLRGGESFLSLVCGAAKASCKW